jgi:serine/threonine protein kinase
MAAADAEEFDVTWWLSPVSVTDDGPRLERAHGDWVWPQAQGRLGAALQQIGENGRYELVGLLNRGGQAYLWAARDHARNDALVVVKTVNPRSGDPVDSARLAREARLLELLAGEPTVMSILDWGPGRLRGTDHGEFETDRPWLVLPYRAHLSLDRALALSGGRLSADAAWRIGLDLGTALNHLHRAQVVHRDLSMRNVLLTPVGCVLADLGMAWAASMVDQTVEQRFTTGITNQSRGVTWGWLAPEAARPPRDGRRPDRDPAADVFGWGLHVFCAAAGRHPWAAVGLQPDEDELFAMYEQGRDPVLAGLDRQELSPALWRLVIAALSTEPGNRPTAAELLADLGPRPSALSGVARSQPEGSSSRVAPSSLIAPVTARSRGPRLRIGAGLLVLATVLTLAAVGSYRQTEHIDQVERAVAAAAAFPVSLRAQAALADEATFPVSGADTERDLVRATTDRLLGELRTDLNAVTESGLEATKSDLTKLGSLRASLPDLRKQADQRPTVRDDPGEGSVLQARNASSYATGVNLTHAITLRLAAAMDAQAPDRAAGDQVDVARSAAEAGVAAAELRALGDSVMRGYKSMNVDTLSSVTETVERQRIHLGRARDLADRGTRPKVQAVGNNDSGLAAWQAAMTQAVGRTSSKIGEVAAWDRFMVERSQLITAVALSAAGEYYDRAQKALRDRTTRLWTYLAIGLLALIVIGLRLWYGRWPGEEPSPSGGETATSVDVREQTRQRAPVSG